MSLKDSIKSVKSDFLTDFGTVSGSSDIDVLKQKYLSRSGLVTNLFKQLGQISNEDKPLFGQLLNQLKIDLNDKLNSLDSNSNSDSSAENIDIFMPEKVYSAGSIHILEQTLLDIKKIFSEIGFNVAYGPEIDDDYHNFSALNVPEHHPARDMRDTFFVDKDLSLIHI